MVECAAPAAHCGGAGIGGSALSGVPWGGSGAYGRTRLHRRQRKLKLREYRPVEVFTLSGGMGLSLGKSVVEKPYEGIAHWLASGLGIFAKQTETYNIEEFVEKFFRFLRETRLQKILLIEIDYSSVYKDRDDEYNDDLDEAIVVMREYFAKHEGVGNKVLISALGKTKIDPIKDLHLTVEGHYNKKHGFGKPAIDLRVTGIPSVLLPRRKEGKLAYTDRQRVLAGRIHGTRKLAGFRKGCEKTFGIVLRDYESHLERIFDVDKIEKEVSSWGIIP